MMNFINNLFNKKREESNQREYNITVVLKGETERRINATNWLYEIPKTNEILQYNGIRYRITRIVHHYKEGFKPYIEIEGSEI